VIRLVARIENEHDPDPPVKSISTLPPLSVDSPRGIASLHASPQLNSESSSTDQLIMQVAEFAAFVQVFVVIVKIGIG
jgi:hypothetical protein